MVTVVLAEEVREGDVESEPGHLEVTQWHYQVPCAGVRYYSYEPTPSSPAEVDPWELDGLTARI